MCDYTGKHFGASYEDACCIDGFLWDLDSGDNDGLTSGGDLACPSCNTGRYLEDAREDAHTTSWGEATFSLYSGAMIMEGAVQTARRINPEETAKWIASQLPLDTFDWPDRQAVLERRASPETIEEITVVIS